MDKVSLPDWVQWAQALFPIITGTVTIFIAGAVGIIAYHQWKTARAKLILDLFEKRYAIYQKAASAVKIVVTYANDNEEQEALRLLRRAETEAEFLFGDDVVNYLKSVRFALIDLRFTYLQMKDPELDRKDVSSRNSEHLKYICDFDVRFPAIAAPYMRMDQKLR